MKLPVRPPQHKAEADSYAILTNKLRELGIFRNVTDNDYGIDFEIELVEDTSVTGKYFKAQVKSSENLRIRKSDNVPTVSGIKQSTLAYWAELSFRTHVILYAVDLKTENIYVSRPIFWQATKLIDGSAKSKTVEFIRAFDGKDGEFRSRFPVLLSKIYAHSPTVPDIISSHKTALRNLKQFLGLYVDVFHYDFHCEVHDLNAFKTLLDTCSVLLWQLDRKTLDLGAHDVRYLYSLEYWIRNSGEWATDEVTNLGAQPPVKALVPKLVEKLIELRKIVFLGKYYWSQKDRTYLRLVYETKVPPDINEETLRKWGYDFEQQQHEVIAFSFFELLTPSQAKKAGLK